MLVHLGNGDTDVWQFADVFPVPDLRGNLVRLCGEYQHGHMTERGQTNM